MEVARDQRGAIGEGCDSVANFVTRPTGFGGPGTRAGPCRRRRGPRNAPADVCTRVHIGQRQRATGGGRSGAWGTAIGVTGFTDRSAQGGGSVGNGGEVVAAVDRDGDRLIGEGPFVVGDTGREGLGCALALGQRLGGSGVVVKGVGPHAGAGIDGDRAVGGRRCADDRPAAGGAAVDIGGSEGAGNSWRSGIRTAVIEVAGFANRANLRSGWCSDNRPIVRAVDRDGDRLIGGGAELVGDAGGESLGCALAFCQGLGGCQGVVEGVGPHAGAGIDSDRAVGGGG